MASMESDVVEASLIAILTGASAIITAYASLVRAKKQGNAECREHLKQARAEAEEATTKLHELVMKEQHGGIDLLMLLSVVLFSAAAIFTGIAISDGLVTKGPPGPQGKQGVPGAKGKQGPQGIIGQPG